MKSNITQQPIPQGYYSYYSAILAVETLIDKIRDCCQKEPVITGALAERKNAVRKIEIECVPKMRKATAFEGGSAPGRTGQLMPQPQNRVLEKLLPRYKNIIPDGQDHSITEASFKYMSIPCSIHFKYKKPNGQPTT